MSPDPAGGHSEDPQTLNRYIYVRNDPLVLTDPTGLDFYLSCSETKENTSTCQGGHTGTTTTDANGKQTFTATVISEKDGKLVDQSGNIYTAQVDGKGVHLTLKGSETSSLGTWVDGSNPVKFTQEGGTLAGFRFEFYQPGKGQNAAGLFWSSMSTWDTETALQRAGFSFSTLDNLFNVGHGFDVAHLRSPGDPGSGRNSGHFIVDLKANANTNVPSTGKFHFGETNPNINLFEHLRRDVPWPW